MPSMPLRLVPQIFSDPPYRQGIDYGPHFNDSMPIQEYLNWSRSWLMQARRVLTDNGSLWLLVSHDLAWRLVPHALDAGLHLHQWLTWFEGFGVNCTKKFNRCSRPLLWFVADPKRFNLQRGRSRDQASLRPTALLQREAATGRGQSQS
jgi:site-specific DNA-methyltransferase (adenine-specific)